MEVTKKTKSLSKRYVFVAFLMALALFICSVTSVSAVVAAESNAAAKDADYCYEEGYSTSVEIGGEGSVLLKNKGNKLPLAQGSKVTILGAMSYNYVLGGTGSAGGTDDENTVMMNDAFVEAGLDVNTATWSVLADACGGARGKASKYDSITSGNWTGYATINEFSASTYTTYFKPQIGTYDKTAIVTFSRSGAEGASPSVSQSTETVDGKTVTRTYLQLSLREEALLEFCNSNFDSTIVLINSAAQMELGFIDDDKYNIDACLWIGHPGEAGIVGVGLVLSGRTNPSGATVDTYAYDMSTNPTFYNEGNSSYTNGQTYYEYEEGIYVGYRYFETAAAEGYFDSAAFKAIDFKNGKITGGYDKVVQFPFGYGQSYTTFSQTIKESNIGLKNGENNSITVTVKNTGSVAGKKSVQLYMEAPYKQDGTLGISGKGLEKAKVVLVGFGKTETIQPGGTKDVTIIFGTDDLASFDNFGQGCYVLEKGTYHFNIQDDAHHWGRGDSDTNKVAATTSVTLANTYVYNDKTGGVGKRSSDNQVAVNAMDDVTAGNSGMLDGYLSRGAFATGMTKIMEHQFNNGASAPNRQVLDENIRLAMATRGKNSYEYNYSTYINGVKTAKTSTIYAHGNNMMPFATKTPDGKDVTTTMPEWGKNYYVAQNASGKVTPDGDGYFEIYTAQPTGGRKLQVDDMTTVDVVTEKGLAMWKKLAEMTSLTEAIEIQGNSGWAVSGVASVGKKKQLANDGPGEVGNGSFAGGTWWPCAVMIAATWNKDLANRQGIGYGNQGMLFGIGVAYAPAMNIHRSPFGGRFFEYYSEDGYISGHIGGNVVAGIQSTGMNVTIKHCALNDSDTNRSGNTTWANEQAIREIYMLTYEISCKEYGANGIMGSLNRIGMSWFHWGMYVKMMRQEWNWNGFLITDGDGNDGDSYNSPQVMLCSEGSMLTAPGKYINTASTVTAYGDATATAYGQNCLQNNIMYCLAQYAGKFAGQTKIIGATTPDNPNNILWIVLGVVGGVVIVGGAIACVIIIKKKKSKGAK